MSANSNPLTEEQRDKWQRIFHAEKLKMKEKWQIILDKPWQVVTLDKGHRTSAEETNNIETAKNFVHERLGSIVPFVFLNEYYSKKDHVGPTRNIEKGILLIYRLLSGKTIPQMGSHIPKTTYDDLENEFYGTDGKTLSNWIDNMMDNYLQMQNYD